MQIERERERNESTGNYSTATPTFIANGLRSGSREDHLEGGMVGASIATRIQVNAAKNRNKKATSL